MLAKHTKDFVNHLRCGSQFWNYVGRRFTSTEKTSSHDSGVVFHLVYPARVIPNFSPACLKLETYARMAGISYKPKYSMLNPSRKGKYPWMEHKGTVIADSNFCLQYLQKEFDVKLDQDLSPYQRGISTAVTRMVEENLYWAAVYERWINPGDFSRRTVRVSKIAPVNSVALKVAQRIVRKNMHGHGLGRHSSEEIAHLGSQDLKAISGILGNEKFMLGDCAATVDAAVFGILANIIWASGASPVLKSVTDELPNLEAYCERMKEAYWPDWDKYKTWKWRNL